MIIYRYGRDYIFSKEDIHTDINGSKYVLFQPNGGGVRKIYIALYKDFSGDKGVWREDEHI